MREYIYLGQRIDNSIKKGYNDKEIKAEMKPEKRRENQMLIFYVRHGDPIYNPNQLTPLGERQAESVARRLARFGMDEIYSSTSNRAMQTAEPLCRLLGKEVTALDFLNERNVSHVMMPSDHGGKAWIWAHPYYSEVLASREVREMGDRWYENPALIHIPMGDVIHSVGQELDALLAIHGYEHDTERGLYRVTKRSNEKRIAIFAHEGMGKVVMSHLLDVPFPYYATHFEMEHTGVTVIRLDDGSLKYPDEAREYARARVLTLSNDAHLYHDGFAPVHHSHKMINEY